MKRLPFSISILILFIALLGVSRLQQWLLNGLTHSWLQSAFFAPPIVPSPPANNPLREIIPNNNESHRVEK